MRAIITKVSAKKESQHGGLYTRVWFKSIPDNKTYRLDVYEKHPQSSRFMPYIQSQAIFDNLNVYKGNIIDGTSSFTFVGVKGKT